MGDEPSEKKPKRVRIRERVAPTRVRRKVVVAIALGVLIVGGGVAWLVFFLIQSRPSDDWLIGTWKSDADTTIAEMQKIQPVPKESEKALREILGRLTITYSGTTWTTEFDKKTESQTYQVVGKDAHSITIKTRLPQSKSEDEVRIHFVDRDLYWLPSGEIVEYFRRIK